MTLPELKVTVFSDYVCPFCYVGHHRLMRLKDTYDLKINWCFLEIHPENSAQGEPVTSLNYSSENWRQLISNLNQVASEENIPLADITFTTNSRDALLLAEAAKALGRETFYRLHETLFTAFFVDNQNIGDRDILKQLCAQCGIDDSFAEAAWQNPLHQHRLTANFSLARQLNISSVPSFVFGKKVLSGVVSEKRIRDAAHDALLLQAIPS